MEVHAHPHTLRKKWTHYLWEFLMLFLAVFCGFLAEYQLEHKIEKDRAKELAISFYNELKRDSATIQTVQMNRLKRDSALSYLKKYFRDSSITNCSKAFSVNFSYGFIVFSPYLFEPKDAILVQLKNSGSLRYFKNLELQNLTADLSEAITNIRTRNEFESRFFDMYLMPYLIKHNDIEFYDNVNTRYKLFYFNALAQYEKSDEIFPFHFSKPEEFDRTESVNITGSYQLRGWGASVKQYADYQKLNAQLLEELREVYKLK
ncbi:MAG: hypothetical protein EPN92_10965 [Chitinophagaceae bacterium]|nr:MAG: hypothetical protein EPN92_10965 [Chitinophagaceae bacterium]